MLTRVELSELLGHDIIKELGITEEVFLSLPSEYQKALIRGCFERIVKESRTDIIRKKLALRHYDFEEKVKEKVLSMFNKK